MALLAVGGRAGGKSYTLFGGDVHEYEERGVIPRLLTEIFNPDSIRAYYCKMSIYLLDGEHIIDMLTTPPSVHVYGEGNVMKSDTLGPVVLCAQEAMCKTSGEAIELLYRALIAISVYTHATVNVLSSFHTVVNIQWLGPNAQSLADDSGVMEVMREAETSFAVANSLDREDSVDDGSMLPPTENKEKPMKEEKIFQDHLYTLQCIEIASFECGPLLPTPLDRLSAFGNQFASGRLLHDMVKKCPSHKFLNNLNCINNSILTYLLQETLFNVSVHTVVY